MKNKFIIYVYASYIVIFLTSLLINYLLTDLYHSYIFFLLLPILWWLFILFITFKFKLNIFYKIIFFFLFIVFIFLTCLYYIYGFGFGFIFGFRFGYFLLILPALIIGIGNIYNDYLVFIKNNIKQILFIIGVIALIGIIVWIEFIGYFPDYSFEKIFLFISVFIFLLTITISIFILQFKNEKNKLSKVIMIFGFVLLYISNYTTYNNKPCSKITDISICNFHEICKISRIDICELHKDCKMSVPNVPHLSGQTFTSIHNYKSECISKNN